MYCMYVSVMLYLQFQSVSGTAVRHSSTASIKMTVRFFNLCSCIVRVRCTVPHVLCLIFSVHHDTYLQARIKNNNDEDRRRELNASTSSKYHTYIPSIHIHFN